MDGPGSAAGTGVEVEWQFDAVDLRSVERWLAALPAHADRSPTTPVLTVRAKPPRRLVDRYLDTDDWRIGRGGFVLRVRQRGRHRESTLKGTQPADEGGLRRRLELTEDLTPSDPAGLGTEGPVGRRVTALAGRRPLRQLFEVRTRRQPFALETAVGEVAEVALDDTLIGIGTGQRPAHLRRVEVEVVPEWADALRPLVEQLRADNGLQPAVMSKFETGLLTAGLAVPGPLDLGPTEVERNATMGELAFVVLRTHLAALLAKEPGTRLGDEPEDLHDMRVATRRLRAAIDLFGEALPARAAALRAELAWIAGALGRVRDLDVQLERVERMATLAARWEEGAGGAFADLRLLLETERSRARRELLADLDSPRWERLTNHLTALARRGPDRRLAASRVPAALAAGDLVVARHRRAVKASRRAQATGQALDFHRVRIRCKALRYSLEFTTPLFGSSARRFTRKLATLQDALGLLQDAEVGRARLRGLAADAADRLPPATIFAMGGIAEHYRVESEERRATMPGQLSALTGKSWRTLATAIGRRQERLRATASRPAASAATRRRGSDPGPAPVPTEPAPVTVAAPVQAVPVTGDIEPRTDIG